jgi:hypothetical protein
MKKIIIEFDEKQLIITDEGLKQRDNRISTGVIVRESSQVPSIRDGDDRFNMLREVAKSEWISKVVSIIDRIMRDKVREGINELNSTD